MHDTALMADLFARLDRLAAQEGATRISRVEVWIGALSHMTPDHFGEHFAVASRGTAAEGADVECFVSSDIHHPDAAGLLLLRVDIES
jgi:hydrogenase nickel incorporation protein HypA/HybF